MANDPNFLSVRPFPFGTLRRLSRREAVFESLCATWVAARPVGGQLAKLVGGPVRVGFVAATVGAPEPLAGVVLDPGAQTQAASPAARRMIDPTAQTLMPGSSEGHARPIDPFAAIAELRIGDLGVTLAGSGLPVRKLAQRLLGGPPELAAPRPLTIAEHAVFALVVATALEDAQIPGEVWPRVIPDAPTAARSRSVELRVVLGDDVMTVIALVPESITVRPPPDRAVGAWVSGIELAIPIVAGRCALDRGALGALAVRDIVTLEGHRDHLALDIGAGSVALRVAPGAKPMEARVASGYVRRDMALPDDAQLELTVTLGTVQLSLRQLVELSIGQVVALGRPLSGPFELRAQGRRIGAGELVDIEGELGVRITSLGE